MYKNVEKRVLKFTRAPFWGAGGRRRVKEKKIDINDVKMFARKYLELAIRYLYIFLTCVCVCARIKEGLRYRKYLLKKIL